MPTESTLLQRIEDLETKVATLETTSSVNLKIGALQDTVGTLLTDIALINEKLENIIVPSDTRFYLSTEEINFIRSGMATVSKLMVDLESLKDSLLRSAQQAL
tara:strand:+ start:441 stop:749 length:309 start_codon:yes stop_codon:yes gene_type:complete